MNAVSVRSRRARRPPPGSGAAKPHVVQFYESPDAILDSATRFLEEGLRGGDATIIIAVVAHRAALEDRLADTGIDLAAESRAGRIVSLDASETLDRLLTGGFPGLRRFTEVIGPLISGAASNAASGRVRVFGEMVAVLCDRGLRDEAVRLELLWNELAKTHSFRLLCGYPMKHFEGGEHGGAFESVCDAHADVVPVESFSSYSRPGQRDREVVALQQKAASLDAEIRERRKAEKTIRSREQELADFLDNAAEGIHKVGADGRILWANSAELKMLGYAAEEYIGRSIVEFHADADVIGDILARLKRGETLIDQPARLRCKDGSIKHVLIHSNVYREDGEFVHTRCFTRDVTDRVRLEEQLRGKLEALDQADRRKNEFLAMLGHELRNPLSPIVTAVEVARRRPDDKLLVSRSLEVVERQTRHITRLVDDLLDVSRITRGTISLRPELVSLNAVIEQAIDQTRPLIAERGHQVSVTLTPSPVFLDADPVRLEQVFSNLLNNAARYTPIGGRIAVEVRLEALSVCVSVTDDGAGLSPAQCETVFDLFVRSPDSGARAPSGLGVGLTLVRRLTEMHGGSVEARSAGPDCGSEFLVRLPLRGGTHHPGEPAVQGAGSDSGSAPVARSRRIMVVDDNEDAAEGLAEYLRSFGHSVRTAYEGASAVEEARRVQPDVVVLDIGLPGADGYDVARRLRGELGLTECLLVALSGYCQESDRQRSREAGFDHHLAKPVDLARLEALLQLPS